MKITLRLGMIRLLLGVVVGGFLLPGTLSAEEHLTECKLCHGSGVMACKAGCDHGVGICPGKCLKPSVGKWEYLEVSGHPPTDIWQKFYKSDGSYMAWNQHHFGEIVETRNGVPELAGKCPLCKGTMKGPCPACKGTGEMVCSRCKGSGSVTETVVAPPAPDDIALKDGRVLKGKVVAQRGEILQVRTTEGKLVTIRRSELATPEGKTAP